MRLGYVGRMNHKTSRRKNAPIKDDFVGDQRRHRRKVQGLVLCEKLTPGPDGFRQICAGFMFAPFWPPNDRENSLE